MNTTTNRLINEKSPYLLQHAHNPVNWFPWEDEAFEKARREQKPIFLSIGYATCHWCHVMEKESFEDPDVARLMNETFVSIKVDREERPDLDNIYMTVCQILTGSGGWPLTIVMTPDKKPFFAATYIPKESRFGRVGMMELIPRLAEVWETRRDEVLDSSEKIVQALQSTDGAVPGDFPGSDTLDKAYGELAGRYDPVHGGFSRAPKFPTPHNLFFLLRHWRRTGNQETLDIAAHTLREMRNGGIFDHVGYGFHRYSTDREWLVPHFEKMLYDQALLAMAYMELQQATGDEEYGRTAREIFSYVLRDMTAPEGGYYSAEDADSEGEEGKFYVWTLDEIKTVVGEEDADFVVKVFNLEKGGNFTEESTARKTGANILHHKASPGDLAAGMNLSPGQFQRRLERVRKKLFKHRSHRIAPTKDDKILTDWNGLMVAALAMGSQVFDDPVYMEAAEKAVSFILRQLQGADGRLLHRYRDGEADIMANLDDYAFLIWGLIELYHAGFDPRHLKTALRLNDDLLAHFWDEETGGFFFTSDDGEKLIMRKKEIYDGAIPSGNAVSLSNLLRLSALTGNHELEKRANAVGRAFSKMIEQLPSGYTHFLTGVDFALGPSHEVVLVGNREADDTRAMIRALREKYNPNTVILLRPFNGTDSEIVELAPFLENHQGMEGRATAYVCRGHACELPTTEVGEMLDKIQ